MKAAKALEMAAALSSACEMAAHTGENQRYWASPAGYALPHLALHGEKETYGVSMAYQRKHMAKKWRRHRIGGGGISVKISGVGGRWGGGIENQRQYEIA